MGRCTARLKMLLFRAKTIVTDSGNVELSCLKKKKKERKTICQFCEYMYLVRYFHLTTVFRDARSLAGHENTRR